MKIVVASGLLLFALVALPVASAPWEGRHGAPGQPHGPPHDNAGAPPGRGAPPPDRRMERDDRRDGALSDEERRGLHRDLDRANRELYRRR